MAVDYREAQGSPTESINQSGSTAQRILHCKWEDRYDNFSALYYTKYPYWTDTDIVATNIDIDPLDDLPPLPVTPGDFTKVYYEESVLTVDYSTVQGQSADPSNPGGTNPMQMTFFEEAWEESLQNLTLSGRQHFWVDATGQFPKTEESEAPVIMIPFADWKLRYINVRNVPDMEPYFGKVNDSAVISRTLGKTFQPETLLFHPWTQTRTVGTDTTGYWDLDLTLSWNPNGWNKYFWAKAKQFGFSSFFQRVSVAPGTWQAYFPLEDFTPILPPEAPP